MKRFRTLLILLLIFLGFSLGLYYIFSTQDSSVFVFSEGKPSIQTISKDIIATGEIVPKEEILIKPNISGVIQEVLVEPGDRVKAGDLLAQLKVIPNLSSLASAKNNIERREVELETAQLNLANTRRRFLRQKTLWEQEIVSSDEFDIISNEYNQMKQTVEMQSVNLKAAKQEYEIISSGSAKGVRGAATTSVRSTVDGMVLEVPVKKGNQVIEANNFNEGTTIAALADVSEMNFEGKIDETNVEKLKEGMALSIQIGAILNKTFEATLTHIAPKGTVENGAVQFEVKASLQLDTSQFIRSGLSANATITLQKETDVLTLDEGLVQYDQGSTEPFVEIKTGENTYERKSISLGLSNGRFVHVISGLDSLDVIKDPRIMANSQKK